MSSGDPRINAKDAVDLGAVKRIKEQREREALNIEHQRAGALAVIDMIRLALDNVESVLRHGGGVDE